MTVTIREARQPEIPPLFARTVESSWNDLPPAIRQRTSRRALEEQIRHLIERLLASGPSTFLIAEDENGHNVGHLWLGEVVEPVTGERRGYVYDLYVTSDVRRQGTGRALMTAAEALARSRGYHEVALTVAAHNEPARRLYESLGYITERLLLVKPLQ